ncbi:MAG: Uma2 family endonuclease [Acidobacteriota bacterium]|nr:Uma2 family endonuclease [Acidobacteriota bacterium]
MATTPRLMTVDEFFALPEEEGVKREFSDGVLIEETIEMGNANPRHELLKINFIWILTGFLHQHELGRIASESMFGLKSSFRIPDISYVSKERFPLDLSGRAIQGAPDIAIEVVSSESAADLQKKVRQYLKDGARAVWVAYPDERTIHTFEPDGTSRLLEGDQYLEAPGILPGFREQVSKFFEGLPVQD